MKIGNEDKKYLECIFCEITQDVDEDAFCPKCGRFIPSMHISDEGSGQRLQDGDNMGSWLNTAYIVWKYYQKHGKFVFKDFVNFMFTNLDKKHNRRYHDDEEDLFKDLEYLEKHGALTICNRNDFLRYAEIEVTEENQKKLINYVRAVEDFPRLANSEYLERDLEKVDTAIKES